MTLTTHIAKRFIFGLTLAGLTLGSSFSQTAHAAPVPPLVCGQQSDLALYWRWSPTSSPPRADNFTTTTDQGERDALAAGYRFVRIEGYVPWGCSPF